MSNRLHLRLDARIPTLTELDQAIENFGSKQGWSSEVLFQSRLAVEELATNIIQHGFGSMPDRDGKFEVEVVCEADRIRIRITDDAWAFNPLDVPDADVGQALDDRGVGGLGVHFVRSLMDEVRYTRRDGRNRLELVKLIGR